MNDFVDLPGEILDLTGLTDEDINQFLDEENPEKKFDLNEYINGDYDYWWLYQFPPMNSLMMKNGDL